MGLRIKLTALAEQAASEARSRAGGTSPPTAMTEDLIAYAVSIEAEATKRERRLVTRYMRTVEPRSATVRTLAYDIERGEHDKHAE